MPNNGKRTINKETQYNGTQLHFNICEEIGVKLDNEQWYEHVAKLVETSNFDRINKFKLSEQFLTINQTSSVIMKKEQIY